MPDETSKNSFIVQLSNEEQVVFPYNVLKVFIWGYFIKLKQEIGLKDSLLLKEALAIK
jgi:hypothetical protein